MLPDLQDYVRQFFTLLIWDQPAKAEAAVADVLTDEAPELPVALRHAMGSLAPAADWNQLVFLLEDLKDMAAKRGWQWETGIDTFCAVIARTEDRDALEQLAMKLGLRAGNGALVCAAYL